MTPGQAESAMTDIDIGDSDVATRLGTVVRQGNDAERCLAVRALGARGGAGAVATLIEALRDHDPDVRCDAAIGLATRAAREAEEALLANLREDPVSDVKVEYVKALQALGSVAAIDLLCVFAIGRGEDAGVDWDGEMEGWDDWLDVQRASIVALGVLGPLGDEAALPRIAKAITGALADEDNQDLWPEAAASLVRLGGTGADAIADLLVHATPLNRKRIATALAHGTPDSATNVLAALLADADAAVRTAAVVSAVALGLGEMARPALGDPAPDVRREALSALKPTDTATLARALRDASPVVRIAACDVISNNAKPLPDLGLTRQLQRTLRSGSADLLAALVRAACVAEPGVASEVIEDVAGHKQADVKVRCACLRALARLVSDTSVDVLAAAAGDDRREVRLEAVAALGAIASGNSRLSASAAGVLAAAIGGRLIEAPEDWREEEASVIELPVRKGAQAASEEGTGSVRIDADGNIVAGEMPEVADASVNDGAIDPDAMADDSLLEAPSPTSTLGAILDFEPRSVDAGAPVSLDDSDFEFLEMTGVKHGRRRIDPQASAPAHVDVRLLAARIAADVGGDGLIEVLAQVATSDDGDLAETASDALARLAEAGADVSIASECLELCMQSRRELVRRNAARAWRGVEGEQAVEATMTALDDSSAVVRAAAIATAAVFAGAETRLAQLCTDDDRRVRLAAATALAGQAGDDIIPVLIDFAMREDGVHRLDAAVLLQPYGTRAEAAVSALAGSDEPRRRLVGLEMLGAMVRQEQIA